MNRVIELLEENVSNYTIDWYGHKSKNETGDVYEILIDNKQHIYGDCAEELIDGILEYLEKEEE